MSGSGAAAAASPGPERQGLPGEDLGEALERQVLATLTVYARGRENAITSRRLAGLVDQQLAADGHELHLAASTLARRCRAAVAKLVAEGQQIASTSNAPRGYFVAQDLVEFEAGGRTLRRHLAGTARRLRAYDRGTAEAVLQLLGQEPLVLPKPAPAGESEER